MPIVVSVPLLQRRCSVHTLEYFAPTSSVVSGKTDFALLSCDGRARIGNRGKFVGINILEPRRINKHNSPAPILHIRFLGPITAAARKTIKAILKYIAELRRA